MDTTTNAEFMTIASKTTYADYVARLRTAESVINIGRSCPIQLMWGGYNYETLAEALRRLERRQLEDNFRIRMQTYLEVESQSQRDEKHFIGCLAGSFVLGRAHDAGVKIDHYVNSRHWHMVFEETLKAENQQANNVSIAQVLFLDSVGRLSNAPYATERGAWWKEARAVESVLLRYAV